MFFLKTFSYNTNVILMYFKYSIDFYRITLVGALHCYGHSAVTILTDIDTVSTLGDFLPN